MLKKYCILNCEFGWPISSYGEHYPHETKKKLKVFINSPLYKSIVNMDLRNLLYIMKMR